MDEAIEQAVNHVGAQGTMGVSSSGGYQFMSTSTNAQGQTVTKIGRLDVNMGKNMFRILENILILKLKLMV